MPHRLQRLRSAAWRLGAAVWCALVLAIACMAPAAPAADDDHLHAQSALHPAGHGAAEIATLFWWLAGAGALIWLAVVALGIYAMRLRRGRHGERHANWLIVGAGVAFPTFALGALLASTLPMMPPLRDPGPVDLTIAVSGEQWWWRVRYLDAGPKGADGKAADLEAVELANEIRLPVGRRVEFLLDSPDVVHSFWIPALGGKMDMIPGRVTRLVLEPTRTGTFRGACAEYCGASHALMNFPVVVMAGNAFDRWLAAQAAPAAAPRDAVARRGHDAFLANGCGACHAVRGTDARARIGPDLTHVGSRLAIAAGTLPGTEAALREWIAHSTRIKPGAHMPAFAMLPPEELDAIAAWLESLQ